MFEKKADICGINLVSLPSGDILLLRRLLEIDIVNFSAEKSQSLKKKRWLIFAMPPRFACRIEVKIIGERATNFYGAVHVLPENKRKIPENICTL